MQLDVVPKERVVQEDSAACTTTFGVHFQHANNHKSPSCIQAPCKAPCHRLAQISCCDQMQELVIKPLHANIE